MYYDTEPLTVEQITVNNVQFGISPESAVVMPSDNLLITVTFSPTAEGEQQAIITIKIDSCEIPVYVFGNPPLEPVRVPVSLITRDGETGELLPCRIFLADTRGGYVLPESSKNIQNKMFFVSPGDIQFCVLSGTYYLSITMGNEYIPIHDEVIRIPVNNQQTYIIERALSRWIHMKEMGWYSCDNQVNNYDRREPEALYAINHNQILQESEAYLQAV